MTMTRRLTAALTPLARAALLGATLIAAPLAATTATSLLGASPAQAQSNPFAPVILINNRAITAYEVDQRRLMLEVFRTPGDLQEQAREALIDDRLRLIAGERMGISVTEQEISAGMEEFAGRAQLSTQEFLSGLAGAGVAEESFRDFVAAGLVWRQVVRQRFGAQAQVTDSEIDSALSPSAQRANAEVLFSEIILPANTPQAQAEAQRIAALVQNNPGNFASYARQYSASGSRANGGRVPQAVPLSNLPPALSQQFLQLRPGQVTAPIPLPNALALFQLSAIRETGRADAGAAQVSYMQYLIPGGRTAETLGRARQISDRLDTCNDLYAINKGQDPARLVVSEPVSANQLPADVALELAKLDENETSATLTRGNALVLTMLCSRTAPRAADADAEPVDREALGNRLVNERVAQLSDGYLAELRANAIIRLP